MLHHLFSSLVDFRSHTTVHSFKFHEALISWFMSVCPSILLLSIFPNTRCDSYLSEEMCFLTHPISRSSWDRCWTWSFAWWYTHMPSGIVEAIALLTSWGREEEIHFRSWCMQPIPGRGRFENCKCHDTPGVVHHDGSHGKTLTLETSTFVMSWFAQ